MFRQNYTQDVDLELQIGLSDATIVRKMNQSCKVMDLYNLSSLIGIMTKSYMCISHGSVLKGTVFLWKNMPGPF